MQRRDIKVETVINRMLECLYKSLAQICLEYYMHSDLCTYGKDFGELEQTWGMVKKKTLPLERQRILF